MRVRAEVLGADHVAQAQARTTAFDADFQRFITEAAWGSLWARLVASYAHDVTEPEWALGWRWDIVLCGPRATPTETPNGMYA